MNVAHIVNVADGNISIYFDGKSFIINPEHCNYKEVIDRLNTQVYDDLENLLSISNAIAEASQGKVLVENGHIYYNGKEVHNTVVDRIVKFVKDGFPFESLVLFLNNLLENPSEDTVKELYLFLETGNIPITTDGCFLAYKKVRDDFCSYHPSPDGTHLMHEIGGLVTMPRGDVDTNRDNTCSKGLHFCSLEYLPQYLGGNGRVLIVKVNPRDVCSIPSDHGNTKARACCYEVLREYESVDRERKEAFEDVYIDENEIEDKIHTDEEVVVALAQPSQELNVNSKYGQKKDGSKFYNVRGNGGRFTKKS